MKLYFNSSKNCVLRLGGAYVGILGNSEQFINIEQDKSILCEILPLTGGEKYLPMAFVIDNNFYDNPPPSVDVFDFISCKKIYIHTFAEICDNIVNEIIFDEEDLCAIICKSVGQILKLSKGKLNNTQKLPDGFTTIEVKKVNVDNTNFLLIYGKTNKNHLFLFNFDTLKTELCLEVEEYNIDNGLNTIIKFNDAARHTASVTWKYDGVFNMTNYSVEEDILFDKSVLDEKYIPLLFMQEVFCGGNYSKYLSDKIKPKAKLIKEYLGDFIEAVVMPFLEDNVVALIYRKLSNVFYAKYYKVETTDRLVTNIILLES